MCCTVPTTEQCRAQLCNPRLCSPRPSTQHTSQPSAKRRGQPQHTHTHVKCMCFPYKYIGSKQRGGRKNLQKQRKTEVKNAGGKLKKKGAESYVRRENYTEENLRREQGKTGGTQRESFVFLSVCRPPFSL